jgi:hypothetical protein
MQTFIIKVIFSHLENNLQNLLSYAMINPPPHMLIIQYSVPTVNSDGDEKTINHYSHHGFVTW